MVRPKNNLEYECFRRIHSRNYTPVPVNTYHELSIIIKIVPIQFILIYLFNTVPLQCRPYIFRFNIVRARRSVNRLTFGAVQFSLEQYDCISQTSAAITLLLFPTLSAAFPITRTAFS